MFDEYFDQEDAQQVLMLSADTIENLEATRLIIRKNRANLLGIRDFEALRSLMLEVEELLADAIAEAHTCMTTAMTKLGKDDE